MSGSSGVDGGGSFYGTGHGIPPQPFQGAYVLPPQQLLQPLATPSHMVHPLRPAGVPDSFLPVQPEGAGGQPGIHIYQPPWGHQGAAPYPPMNGSAHGVYPPVYSPYPPMPPPSPIPVVQAYPYVAPPMPPTPYPPPGLYAPNPHASSTYVTPPSPRLNQVLAAPPVRNAHGSDSVHNSGPLGTNTPGHSGKLQESENGYVTCGAVHTVPQPPTTPTMPISDMDEHTTNGGSQRYGPEIGIRAPPGIGCSKARGGGSFNKEREALLLHGTLEAWIYQAKRLPNMDLVSEKVRQCCTMFSTCQKPQVVKSEERQPKNQGNRERHIKRITSDPYVSIVVCGARLARTRVITNDTNPEWHEHFLIPVAHFADEVVFRLKDNDMFGAQHIGDVYIPVSKLLGGQKVEEWFDILGPGNKVIKEGARLHLAIQFFPVEDQNGIGPGPDYQGIQRTYFSLRKGCSTALYQDAHVHDGQLPNILLENGKYYEHRKCWEEICQAILGAHHMIYIAGWSIYDQVKLIREKPPPGLLKDAADFTLGELLKRKSSEGVRVLLLVWDDKTSHNNVLLKTEGVMRTHDEDTRKYFKHSGVTCRLAPRYPDSKLSWFRQKVVGTLYTHHQKIVLVDSLRENDNVRQLTSFVGGIDLCDGRYDTPDHALFRTLQNVHKGDYHQPTFASGEESGGPRQPWHDLHSRVEGPAAYDVLTNFEQRWKKSRWRTGSGDLIEVDRVPWLRTPRKPSPLTGDPALYVTREDDPETWHDQIFRSIDSGSAKGFPKTVQEAEEKHLVCMKNLRVDASIHAAYVQAIRRAQHFVYIENQYFLGSSYHWPKYKNAGADHLIPMELALKIASKIRAGQQFMVYVVIPMFPEGPPESAASQEILFFQYQTVQMMYTIVADALKQKGILGEHKPQDYLLFFCLGNREEKPLEEQPPAQSPADAHQAAAQQSRRFMVYVHAKGMIVDDEYVIIGSANINQRSMDGSRDTEIAMGAYQPEYTWARKGRHPQGQIYGFRSSLWAEHLATFEDWFRQPGNLETARKLKRLGDENWAQWASDRVTEMRAHLLTYPYQVEDDGTVNSLPDFETFPDVGGKILGCSQQSMPDGLTS